LNSKSRKEGAIYYYFNQPELKNIANSNNSAKYGPDIQGYQVKIFLNRSPSDEMMLDNISSKIHFISPLILKLFSYEGQTMIQNIVKQILIQAVDKNVSSIGGLNFEILKAGIVTFDAITFVAFPGTKDAKNLSFK
jgi:hypothetical protein